MQWQIMFNLVNMTFCKILLALFYVVGLGWWATLLIAEELFSWQFSLIETTQSFKVGSVKEGCSTDIISVPTKIQVCAHFRLSSLNFDQIPDWQNSDNDWPLL